MSRLAALDIGTNSVTLVVADDQLRPLLERSEVTRLGRGVDRTRVLSSEGLSETLRVLRAFAEEARALGARRIAAGATSAARDATNGEDLVRRARDEAGLEVEILSGEREAQLSYRAAAAEFGREGAPLVAIDLGAGSTEVVYGTGQAVRFHRSLDLGSVRLTERHVRHDPPAPSEREAIQADLAAAFSTLPRAEPDARVVGVAATVTTLYAVTHALASAEAPGVHGATLSRAEVAARADELFRLTLEERKRLPGLHPGRADVIPAGALVLAQALDALGASACRVSDRGVRWGLLIEASSPGA